MARLGTRERNGRQSCSSELTADLLRNGDCVPRSARATTDLLHLFPLPVAHLDRRELKDGGGVPSGVT
jgi:hypothetical protein